MASKRGAGDDADGRRPSGQFRHAVEDSVGADGAGKLDMPETRSRMRSPAAATVDKGDHGPAMLNGQGQQATDTRCAIAAAAIGIICAGHHRRLPLDAAQCIQPARFHHPRRIRCRRGRRGNGAVRHLAACVHQKIQAFGCRQSPFVMYAGDNLGSRRIRLRCAQAA